MQMRRFTRLTNGFSKSLKHLEAAIAQHFFHYNFMRIHENLRVTPAMQAGISNHLINWEEFLTVDFEDIKAAQQNALFNVIVLWPLKFPHVVCGL